MAWAMRRWYRNTPGMADQMNSLLSDLYKAIGWKARLTAPFVGRFLHFKMKREERRLADNYSYEPETFLEKSQPSVAAQTVAEDTVIPKQAYRRQIGKKPLQPGLAASERPHDQWRAYADTVENKTETTTDVATP
jgi:hypothetical protein